MGFTVKRVVEYRYNDPVLRRTYIITLLTPLICYKF